MDVNFKKIIKTHAEYVDGEECCGFLGLDNLYSPRVLPCDNIHIDKKRFFEISADDFLKYKKKFNILATYHSHPTAGCQPSEYDKVISDEWALPSYVYSVKAKEFFLYFPKTYRPPELLGRVYVSDLQNCFRFVVDYYNKINALGFMDFNYCLDKNGDRFGEKTIYTIKNFIKKNKFYEVGEFQKHDLLLFETNSTGFSHFAVFIGDNKIVHHERKRLSTATMLDEKSIKNIFKIFRNPKLRS